MIFILPVSQIVINLHFSNVFIEKNPHVNGPVPFKPDLFIGQLEYLTLMKACFARKYSKPFIGIIFITTL